MELDKRIMSGKKPLDCFDIDKAEQFIGKKGYITNFLQDFCNLNKVKTSKLKTVSHTEPFCYFCGSTGKKYFLPVEWVKPEKKYRPLNNTEFVDLFDSGKFRSIRLKDSSTQRLERLIITDIYVQGDYLYAKLNSSTTGYSPEYFFSNCEYLDGKEWKPFGVEE